ncbi:response regulator transcription factor [Clostridium botulinum]|uniref:Stage 0 sporulation protein A homolog n=1 Tax=Clostridium botulinum (strain Eklund 17B / Type B) TaxID=935198 RepID=B2TQA9_CLOBB|nr:MULTISPECIES: response regulator transcription factor [Clostridium]ACD24956.1 alkaline phosphatase synthesis transcriptional regulatory protein PhoP [Clostridium botulinum B str. Eklund 17B (NRP)]AIY80627.1 transcriptional regulatory protein yycF [Clostridium botulinum 202F]KFX56791.1 PhoP family transcriptional regulator [Clostridium botulinum]KFX59631.1 PhoP family transcriptional regulator [Clostridium botulinum]KON14330.1 PhoP family transcriptional regulator [Clostridium botulinum]
MLKKRILVVEDEFSINDTLKFALSKENFEVKGAYNGESALKLLEEFQPHLVLLDIMLPDISGFELCKSISQKFYVIMLTARDDVIDKILGMEIGADDYITKPFEIREVIARINAIFRTAGKNIWNNENNNMIMNVLECNTNDDNKGNTVEDEISINFNTRTVIKDGEEIILKRKEFELLSYLYKNKGIVFTRQQLLNEVWGYDYYGDTRTVDVHIRRLRANLGEDKENSVIETVFGVGYVIR